MPRPLTLVSAVLAVVLLVSGCGSDESTAEDDPQTTVSDVATSDTDQAVTTSESAEQSEQSDQPDAAPEPEPVPEPEPQPAPVPVRVPLGARFGWCAGIEALGDAQEQTQARFDEAEAAHQAAQDALAVAADELDRAEAQAVLDATTERHQLVRNELRRANRELLEPLLFGGNSSDDTEAIALQRAQDAYMLAADPTVLELLTIPAEPWMAPTTTPPAPEGPELGPLTVDEVLTAIEDLQIRANAVEEAYSAALPDIEGLHAALQNAETPSEVLATHLTFSEKQAALRSQEAELSAVLAASEADWQKAYEDFARVNEAISDDEYYASLDSITIARIELEDAIGRAQNAARATSGRDFFFSLEDAIRAVLIADTDGMRAFWASLSESCQ